MTNTNTDEKTKDNGNGNEEQPQPMTNEMFIQRVHEAIKDKTQEEANRIIAHTFLIDAGVKDYQFERFLQEKKFRHQMIYDDIAAIFGETGYYGNLQSYIQWIKNSIEDIYRTLNIDEEQDKIELEQIKMSRKRNEIRLKQQKRMEDDPEERFRFFFYAGVFFIVIGALESFFKWFVG
jgi:hypothetical protein